MFQDLQFGVNLYHSGVTELSDVIFWVMNVFMLCCAVHKLSPAIHGFRLPCSLFSPVFETFYLFNVLRRNLLCSPPFENEKCIDCAL
jgi:hypothetical protein